MGRVSQLAVRAAELALQDAGLLGDPLVRGGRMGVACGSSIGSTPDINDFAAMMLNNDASALNANSYVRMMPHTAAANIGIFFGLTGRIIPTSSACTSGSQGIGYAYEAIKYGRQTLMLCGGAEELCPTEAMAFDMLYATSRRNDAPGATPRPYDRDRDGLVVGEGAGIMVLEELEHARLAARASTRRSSASRSNSDGVHVTRPEEATMRLVMELALRDAGIGPSAIGYVNGHGTATEHGDIAETRATASAVRRADADQLAEELPRSHARRLRCARSMVQHRDDESRLVCADAQSRKRRSALRRARLHRGRWARAGKRIRHEQQLRVWRCEHLTRVSPLAVAVATRILKAR